MPGWSKLTLDTWEDVVSVVRAMRKAGYGERDISKELIATCVVDLDILSDVMRGLKKAS